MMFWATRKPGSQGWTAVDASSDAVCGVSVARPRAGRKPQVLKCETVADALESEALSSLARKLTVPKFDWNLALSRGDYKIFVVPQPAVEAIELAQSVRWTLGSMLDYPVDEAVVDRMPIPTAQHLPNKQPHLYAVAAKRELIEKHTEAFRKARLPLRAVDIRETAQRNIAVMIQRSGEGGLAIVAPGKAGVQITFTFEGELYLDRFIEEPLTSMMEADDEGRRKIFDRITLQAQRSIDLINRTLPFMSVGRVVVAPSPVSAQLVEYLATNISESVEALDLRSVFDLSATPELASPEAQSQYFVALGAALRDTEKPA